MTTTDESAAAAAAARTTLVQWTNQLRADLAETLGGVILRGARPVRIGVGGTARPATAGGTLIGWNLSADDDAEADAGEVELYDGEDLNGDQLANVRIPLGQTDTAWFGPGGISVQHGLFVVTDPDAPIRGWVYLRGSE